MNEPTSQAEEAKPHSKGFLLRATEAWQWLVAVGVGAFALILLVGKHQLEAPGAPVILFWSTLAVGLLIAAAHMPPAFMRFPRKAKVGAYLSILAYVVLFGLTLAEVDAAWVKTPKGAVEAKQDEIERQAELKTDKERRQVEAQLAEAQGLQQQLTDRAEKLDGCFSTFGHKLPAFEKAVREGLHNPHAFEHVETIAIVPDAAGNNVAMTFRAENTFGALRTWVIKASIDPDGCEATAIGDPEQM